MRKAIKYMKKLAVQKHAQDETAYIMSSQEMTDILLQGKEDIENGRGEVVKIEDLWK